VKLNTWEILQTEIENNCPLKYPFKRLLIARLLWEVPMNNIFVFFLLLISIKPPKVSYSEDSPLVHGQVNELCHHYWTTCSQSIICLLFILFSHARKKNCLYPLLDRRNSHLLLIQSYTYQFIKYLDMIVGWIFRQLFNYKSKISGFLQIFFPWNQGNPWDAPMSKYHRSEISLCGTLDTTIHEQTHTASETHSQTVCCSSSSRSNFKSHFCAFKVLNAAIACCRCTTTATSTPTSDGSSVS